MENMGRYIRQGLGIVNRQTAEDKRVKKDKRKEVREVMDYSSRVKSKAQLLVAEHRHSKDKKIKKRR